jgi:acyl carrier protein
MANMPSALQISQELSPSGPMHHRPELHTLYVAPRNQVEQMLADILQQSLGIEQVGVYDDFFELGGDSLLGARVIAQLRETFQVNLPVGIFFQEPTVAGIAKLIEMAK